MATSILPQPTANPILSEIMGLSPEAKTALGMAGHAMPGAGGPPQLPPPAGLPTATAAPLAHPGLISPQMKANVLIPHDTGPTPNISPIQMPGAQGSVPQLGIPSSPEVEPQKLGTIQGDTLARQELLNHGPAVNNIYHDIANSNFGENHPFLGKLLGGLGEVGGKVGDTLATAFPGIGQQIPGTTANHNLLLTRANNALTGDYANAKNQAELPNIAAQESEREAFGKKAGTIADEMVPVPLSAEDAKAIGHPEYEGMMMAPHDVGKFFGNAATNTSHEKVGEAANANKVTTTGMNNTTSAANNAATNASHETIAQAADKTRQLVAAMHDTTSRANNENTVAHKGAGGTPGVNGNFKVPADVTRRAALGSNVVENANAVDQLLQRRPDIVGAAGGRYTNVQQMIGSNDPDIAELGVRMHNIALASNGAHGVRAQQAIAQTEEMLFHNFEMGPQAVHSSLNAQRSSMQTFLDDEKNFSTTGKREPDAQTGGAAPSVGNTTKADGDYDMGGKHYRVEGGKVYAR